MKALKMMTVAVLALMIVAPLSMLGTDADAAGSWWGNTTEIDIEAGSSFQYRAIATPDGKTIKNIGVQGPLEDYFTVTLNSISAKIPSSLEAGDYEAIMVATTDAGSSWMRFIFHVSAAPDIPPGYAANAPIINDVDVGYVGNNTKMANIRMSTTNADTLMLDFNDGISTEKFTVRTAETSITHKFNQVGLFAMKIVASNEFGSTESVVVYDAGMGQVVSYGVKVDDGSDSHPVWILYAFVAAAIVAALAFVFIRHPVALVAAIGAAAAAVIDYLWII